MDLPIPFQVERALKKLGRDLSLARRRRKLTQAMLAERIGASVATVRRIENGHPGTAIHLIVRILDVLGELDRVNLLLDSSRDGLGLMLMDEQVPERVRRPGPDKGVM